MKNNQIIKQNSFTEFLLYTTPNGKVKVEIFLHDENIWLTQKLIASLFNCSTDNVSLHFKNIFESNELQEKLVTEEFSVTANDGKKYKTNLEHTTIHGALEGKTQTQSVKFYNLERKNYFQKELSTKS